ncbi:MAG: hypothetical protein ACHQVK_04790, partial [Candidatus Paceibacterales bacterium]
NNTNIDSMIQTAQSVSANYLHDINDPTLTDDLLNNQSRYLEELNTHRQSITSFLADFNATTNTSRPVSSSSIRPRV